VRNVSPLVVPARGLNYCVGGYFTAGEKEMKRLGLGLLLASIAGAACAADLPAAPAYSKAPAVVAPVTNWTGFYVGAMGGYAAEATSDPLAMKGGFAGATVGYNWQFGTFVAGLEADGAWADVSQSSTLLGVTMTAKADALATVRGRVGVAFDQVLLYGTGGLALADAQISGSSGGLTASDSKTLTGWTAGAGVEWMFMPHWSLKAEYLYRSLAGQTFFATQFLPGIPTGTLNLNSGQVGVNFHF
jgi:outer membrane immunogenic protein